MFTANVNGVSLQASTAAELAEAVAAIQSIYSFNQSIQTPAQQESKKVADRTGSLFTVIHGFRTATAKVGNTVADKIETGANWIDTEAVAYAADKTSVVAGKTANLAQSIQRRMEAARDARR